MSDSYEALNDIEDDILEVDSPTAEQIDEADDEQAAADTGVKDQDTSNHQESIPYDRFKEVNESLVAERARNQELINAIIAKQQPVEREPEKSPEDLFIERYGIEPSSQGELMIFNDMLKNEAENARLQSTLISREQQTQLESVMGAFNTAVSTLVDASQIVLSDSDKATLLQEVSQMGNVDLVKATKFMFNELFANRVPTDKATIAAQSAKRRLQPSGGAPAAGSQPNIGDGLSLRASLEANLRAQKNG